MDRGEEPRRVRPIRCMVCLGRGRARRWSGASWGLPLAIQYETRPRLELVGLRLQLRPRREAGLRQHLLPTTHSRLVQIEDMDDPQVYLPDGIAVIVDQPD